MDKCQKYIYLDEILKSGYCVKIDKVDGAYKVLLKVVKKNQPQKGALIYKRFLTLESAKDYYNQVIKVVENNKEAVQKKLNFWNFQNNIFKFLMVHRN